MINDFFFKEVDTEYLDAPSMDRDRFLSSIRKVPANFVAKQVERFLSEHKNLILLATQSNADLGAILAGIGSENICKLEIYTHDRNVGSLKYKFAVDIYLVNGVVSVCGGWCDSKGIYFDDYMANMIAPIYKNNLQSRTILNCGIAMTELSDNLETVVDAFVAKSRVYEDSCKDRALEYLTQAVEESS